MYDAIILCGGKGKRTNLSYNKIFYPLNNRPLITYTVAPFLLDKDCENVIIVYQEEDYLKLNELLKDEKIRYTKGGVERFDSVENGLKVSKSEYVLIHDGARPNVTMKLLDNIKAGMLKYSNAIPKVNVTDTIYNAKEKCYVERSNFYLIQTPQAFKKDEIIKAYKLKENDFYTDDSMIYEKYINKSLHFIDGDKNNFKFTTVDDGVLLEGVLKCA